jgi:hypothetical protein
VVELCDANSGAVFVEFIDSCSPYDRSRLPVSLILGVCCDSLDDHNRKATKSLEIVLFHAAIGRIIALAFALSMSRGHSTLIHVDLIGHRSLAGLALQTASSDTFKIPISATSSVAELRGSE